MKKYKRIFTIVIDSFGAGEMPDAAQYGDEGTDTIGHISQNVDEFTIPNRQYRKRHYDRTLGNDGTSHHKTV